MKNVQKSIFDNMTCQYALSKTLRFELAPTEQTLHNLQAHEILCKDFKKSEAYKEIKPLFDELHNKFIDESLENSHISWSEYFENFLQKTDESKRHKKISPKSFDQKLALYSKKQQQNGKQLSILTIKSLF